ncbi:alpha/beta fold hydrolase [Streptomyces sp. NPDC048623]|uniref:alpha/beta fold hydrolase n=1 Tax=Streptomyces sp. NPDC048623 TaxID=3155761 RepID=UPI0034161326
MDREGVDRVVVVGHDFGGPVASHLIAAAPERVAALGLLATNAFSGHPHPLSPVPAGSPGSRRGR